MDEYRIISREELDALKVSNRPPLRVSVSRLQEHKECPGKTYHTQIKPSEEDVSLTWPATLWGTALHAMIEAALLDEERVKLIAAGRIDAAVKGTNFLHALEEARREAEADPRQKFIKTRKWQPEEMAGLGDKWVRIVLRALNRSIDFANCIVKPEVPVYILFPHETKDLVFTGIMDIAIEGEDFCRVIDLKTTGAAPKWYVVDWRKDIQSNSYRWVAELLLKKRMSLFTYLVVASKDKVLISQSKSWDDSSNDSASWMVDLLTSHRKELEESWDQNTWKPDERTCTFCSARLRCPRSESRKKW